MIPAPQNQPLSPRDFDRAARRAAERERATAEFLAHQAARHAADPDLARRTAQYAAELALRQPRQDRAVHAYRSGQKAPRPARLDRPAPARSRQFAAYVPTAAATDRRLSPAARAVLVVLLAQCSRKRQYTAHITRRYLQRRTGYGRSQVSRALRDLRYLAYITTETAHDTTGRTTGIVVTLTEAVVGVGGGVHPCAPHKIPSLTKIYRETNYCANVRNLDILIRPSADRGKRPIRT